MNGDRSRSKLQIAQHLRRYAADASITPAERASALEKAEAIERKYALPVRRTPGERFRRVAMPRATRAADSFRVAMMGTLDILERFQDDMNSMIDDVAAQAGDQTGAYPKLDRVYKLQNVPNRSGVYWICPVCQDCRVEFEVPTRDFVRWPQMFERRIDEYKSGQADNRCERCRSQEMGTDNQEDDDGPKAF
jgi:hypothetical protein